MFTGTQNIGVGLEDNLKYYSVIKGYTEGLGSGSRASGNRITCRNLSILSLYQIALSEYNLDYIMKKNRTVIEIPDTLTVDMFITDTNVLRVSERIDKEYKYDHHYCYELIVPDSFTAKQKFAIMVQDLNRIFGGL